MSQIKVGKATTDIDAAASQGTLPAVGFITGDLTNPFHCQVAAGLERGLRPHGLDLFVATSDDDPDRERQISHTLLDHQMEALVLASTAADHRFLRGESHRGTPVVLVGRPPVNVLADCVMLNDQDVAYGATLDLIDRGHRDIAVLTGPRNRWTDHERITGFQEAMLGRGITGWRRYVRQVRDASQARAVMTELLADKRPPTAVLALDNRMLLGVIDALGGTDGPVAVIGLEPFELSDVLGLTTVTGDPVQLGERAAELTLRRIADPTAPPVRQVVTVALQRRGSGERPPP